MAAIQITFEGVVVDEGVVLDGHGGMNETITQEGNRSACR